MKIKKICENVKITIYDYRLRLYTRPISFYFSPSRVFPFFFFFFLFEFYADSFYQKNENLNVNQNQEINVNE